MEKNIIISLKVIQTDIDNHTHTMDIMSEAKFYKKGNVYYIIYKETELTGMQGTTTTVKLDGEIVNLIRFGNVTSNFVFEENVKHGSIYGTQFGEIEMSTKASKIKNNVDENGGEIFVEYVVEIDGQEIGCNSFYLKIISINKDSNII